MSAEASSRLSQWWLHGVSALDRVRPLALGATPEAWPADIATRILRWGQGFVRRLAADGQPQSADELLAYARRIERHMPGLAADLRAAALRHEQTQG